MIVAFLQNSWYHGDLERWRRRLEGPDRQRWIAMPLFMGCVTGQRLKAAFGDRCDDIYWEEASREISNKANFKPNADPNHIAKVIADQKPKIVLAFGRVAEGGIKEAFEPLLMPPDVPYKLPFTLVVGPHPAARGDDVRTKLKEMAQRVDSLMVALKIDGAVLQT